MAPEETTSTSAPRREARRCRRRSRRASRFFSPLARSTSSAEPILTTMRRASTRRLAGQRPSQRLVRASSAAERTISSRRRAQHLRHAVAGDAGKQQRLLPARLLQLLRLLLQVVLVEHVDLVQRQDLGLVGQAVAIGLEFVPDGACRRCRPCPPACRRPGAAARAVRSTWPRKRSPRPAPSWRPRSGRGCRRGRTRARRQVDHAEVGVRAW